MGSLSSNLHLDYLISGSGSGLWFSERSFCLGTRISRLGERIIQIQAAKTSSIALASSGLKLVKPLKSPVQCKLASMLPKCAVLPRALVIVCV